MGIKDRKSNMKSGTAVAAIQSGNVAQLVQSMVPQIERALPTLYERGGLDADRFARLLMTTIRKTPKLLECTPESLLGSLMEVARLGLDPSSDLVYLLPYRDNKSGKSNVEVIVSARGFIELALRTGRVLKIESRAVFEGDFFQVDYGEIGASSITHRPGFESDRLTHAWARAIGDKGQIWFEVMSRQQIERISQNRRGPWKSDFNEMARKTVIRRLSKQLPQSPDLTAAQSVDDSVVLDFSPETNETSRQHFDRVHNDAEVNVPDELPQEIADSIADGIREDCQHDQSQIFDGME